jgi:hypothetical protein
MLDNCPPSRLYEVPTVIINVAVAIDGSVVVSALQPINPALHAHSKCFYISHSIMRSFRDA